MPDEIPLWPVIPEELRLAARRGTLIPFIGAGLSRLAGCPGWDELAHRALMFFVENGTISHGHMDQLSRLTPRVKLSLACLFEKETGKAIDFAKLLCPRDDKKGDWERAHRYLSQLGSIFVTTNYDQLLDALPPASAPLVSVATNERATLSRVAPPQVLYDPGQFREASLRTPHTVIHLHGSVLSRRSMVLTPSDYLERYFGHRPTGPAGENSYLSFLEVLFKVRNVLFIGYGLEELEILEYVFQKARVRDPSEIRHYLLQGFFAHEAALMRSLKAYYRQEFGVGLLPYSREKRDWSQLIEVLENLAGEIPCGPLLASQGYRDMEELLT